MWIVALTSACTGYLLARKVLQKRSSRSVRLLEKTVRCLFERSALKSDERRELLLSARSCGCRLSDLTEREISLFTNARHTPPGEVFYLSGVKVGYLYPYFGRHKQLLAEDREVAEMIYRFKDGIYDDELLEELVCLCESMSLGKDKLLVCIPASTQSATDRRYRRFSADLSARLAWKDGYGIMMPVDRIPCHLTGERRMLGEKNYYLQKSLLRGRKVVLFDDILTTGTTLFSVAGLIERAGGQVLGTVFIGRTLDPAVTWRTLAGKIAGKPM